MIWYVSAAVAAIILFLIFLIFLNRWLLYHITENVSTSTWLAT